jgi:hypothetical protein
MQQSGRRRVSGISRIVRFGSTPERSFTSLPQEGQTPCFEGRTRK